MNNKNIPKKRKSKIIYNTAKDYELAIQKGLQKLEETKKLFVEAEKEEKNLLEETDKEIQKLCKEKGMRCGVPISIDAINKIIEALVKSEGKPVFIKAVVEYYDEDDDS